MTEEKKNVKIAAEQEEEAQESVAVVEAVEAEVIDDNKIISLSRPFHGKNELILNFEKIKGSTLLKCEKKAKNVDGSIMVPQLSMVFQAHVAAAALGVRYDDIINLPAPDFMIITLKISRFLNGAV